MSAAAALVAVSVARAGRPVLRRASLRIEAGERIALVGPNGAGKSTVVRVLAGLDDVDEGEVRRAGRVALVPQACADSLFPWFSVLRNVAMPRLVAGDAGALDEATRLCARILPDVDPARRVGQLSGGEKQSVAIARALATPAALMVADEPFASLSTTARARVRDVIDDELADRALLLVTHDRDDVTALTTRTVTIDEGLLVPR